jgi:hypothetical protein
MVCVFAITLSGLGRAPTDSEFVAFVRSSSFLYKVRGTLILCPSHLVKQWEKEIEKHTNPQLRTLVITTKTNHVKYTYRDFVQADVVIVSFQFIANRGHYNKLAEDQTTTSARNCDAKYDVARRYANLETMYVPPLSLRCNSSLPVLSLSFCAALGFSSGSTVPRSRWTSLRRSSSTSIGTAYVACLFRPVCSMTD